MESKLKVYSRMYPPPSDRTLFPSISEHQIMLNLTGSSVVERRLDYERWQRKSSFAGSFTFVSGDRVQEWLWSNNVELIMVEFSQKLLAKVALEGFDLDSNKIELIDRFLISDPLLQQIVLAIYRESQADLALDRLYFESLQNTFLLHILRYHCHREIIEPSISGGLTKLQLQEVIDYVNSNLARNISLAELANIIKVSPPHFGRLFKQTMKITPHQYVMQCRIRRAKKLLREEKITHGPFVTS